MRHALLLAGGQGKRFWPKSRRQRPKQFVSFDGQRSLLRATAERLLSVVPFERQWVVTHADYVARVRKELPEVPTDQIIGEPRALNTAAAVGLGATLMQARDPKAVMMVQAADHWIRDERRLTEMLSFAFSESERRRGVVLVGFAPTRPATGYGYIQTGRRLRAARGLRVFEVKGYKEKPSAATARRYLENGGYLWNGCMFFWPSATILDAIGQHLPALAKSLGGVASASARGDARRRAIARLYRESEPMSIEHGVVERLGGKIVLEGDCGWEDVGTWGALAHLFPADDAGNVVRGLHHGSDTKRSLVLSDGGLVVTCGVRDLIVVKDGDTVLILPRSREGDIRELVAGLERDPRYRRYL